ncbi:MAG: 6-bladed beta-propeller, partial [Bacteroidota bacterium]
MKYLFLTFITGLTAFSTFSEFHSHSSGKDTFKGEKEIHFTANDFHDSVLLEGVPLGLSSYIGKHPRNIEVIEGKYLIFDTYKNEHHGHLYDIETHEVRHLGPNGQDAGKILSMNKFDVNSATGKIYAFDFKKDEIVTYSLKNMFEGDSLNFEKVTKLSGFETPLYPQVG